MLSDQFNFVDTNNFSDLSEQVAPRDQRTVVPTKPTKQQLLEAEIDKAFNEVFEIDQQNPIEDNPHAAVFDEMADDLYQTMLQEQAKEEAAAGFTPIPNQAKALDSSTQGWTNGGTIPYNTDGEAPASLPAATLASLLSDPFTLQTYLRQYWDTAKNRFSAANLLLGLQTSSLQPALAGAEGGNLSNYGYGAYADQLNRSFKQFAVQEGNETSRNSKYNSSEGGSNSQWFDKHGNPIWPSNRGFAGEPVTQILQPGTRVDRYGYDGGTFVSPEGTPYSQRALAPGTEKKPYTLFEVMKPIAVQGGKQPLGLVKKVEECNMNLMCQFLNCWNREY
jgi:hypothetical protein